MIPVFFIESGSFRSHPTEDFAFGSVGVDNYYFTKDTVLLYEKEVNFTKTKKNQNICVDTVAYLYYSSDNCEATPLSIKELESFVKNTNWTNNLSVEIRGYTDSNGSVEYNKKLATKRIHNARDILRNIGLEDSQISLFLPVGANDFVAKNDSEIGRQKNRRVEIRFKCE